jgi:hypothetical protein
MTLRVPALLVGLLVAIIALTLEENVASASQVCAYKVQSALGFFCPVRHKQTVCISHTAKTGDCQNQLVCLAPFLCGIRLTPLGGPLKQCPFGSRRLTNLICFVPRPPIPINTRTPTVTRTATVPTFTATPSSTPPASGTPTATPPATPTSTPQSSATPSATAQASATNTLAATPTSTSGEEPSSTPTNTAPAETTATASPTNSVAATNTNTVAATATDTAGASPTVTNTPEPTFTGTVAATATNTAEATASSTTAATATDTPLPTSTSTPLPTSTPTATAGLFSHACTLTTGSDINIFSAAFPVPLNFPTTGSSISISGGGNAAGCDIETFNPIFIIGIGFVCVAPASGCDPGVRNCTGEPGSGAPLGIEVRSDGNIGACSANTTCSTSCDTFCPTLGAGFAQLSSGCTGYCSGETPADTACTSDAQCGMAMPMNGACNGPDNLAEDRKNICQCTCIKADAFGGSDAGDLQCNLGADLTVEMASPCNGTDLLIDVGQACIPVTTQRAKGRIDDGNFVPGSTVPGPTPGPDANDRSGVPLSCAQLDTSTTTGLEGVGAVNFFGSTIGDLSVGLRAVCM